MGERGKEGLRTGGNGSCKAEPNQQRAFPGTLDPTYSFPQNSGKKQALDSSGALPAQEFLPTPQDIVPLTWPKGYRRQDKGRDTDLPTRFH